MIARIALILLLFSGVANATAPVVFFSDMTDGPVTGWEGSATKGAAVTIYGINFGSSRGTSYVTVANATAATSVDITAAGDYAEWGATTDPITPTFNGIDQLQRVTFFLNSSMGVTGSYSNSTITVTTSEGTSLSIPFHCRAIGSNKIYFISKTSASDTYSGLYATFQSGTSGPKASVAELRDILVAGDVAYLGAGVWDTPDPGGYAGKYVLDFYNTNHADGTEGLSITFKAYPAAAVQLGTSSVDDLSAIGTNGSTEATNHVHYWTFSNLTVNGHSNAINFTKAYYAQQSSHCRFIGLDATTHGGTPGDEGKTVITFISGKTQTYIYLLGCYIHDPGVDNRGDTTPVQDGYGFSVSGSYPTGTGHDHMYIGWNEVSYIPKGHAFYIYGHQSGDSVDNLFIHDNWFHHTSMSACVLGTGDDTPDYGFVTNEYFYNNVVSDSASTPIAIGDPGALRGGDGGNFYLYNNTIYDMDGGYAMLVRGSDTLPTALYLSNNIVVNNGSWFSITGCGSNITCSGSNNLWYGNADTVPAWSTSNQTTDPAFTNAASNDFTLQAGSPAIDNGSSSVSAIVTKDARGIPWASATYEIGAFLYGAGAGTTTRSMGAKPGLLP